jgi:excisionase family DNA binding protein
VNLLREIGPYITVDYAAELTGYHKSHIQELVKSGNVKGAMWVRAIMVHRGSLMRWIRKAGIGPQGPRKKRETLQDVPVSYAHVSQE